ncbi:WEAK CHLOROPLAST MOVEMENT UNDER BLUE LIGHT-like protein [Perilla frutescens var. hirtella]|nr:WEAK CHLOROPLAST MOVEMENT UNDER BLUE LIGHT-like protein [Perilla frutescens var. hirtella]
MEGATRSEENGRPKASLTPVLTSETSPSQPEHTSSAAAVSSPEDNFFPAETLMSLEDENEPASSEVRASPPVAHMSSPNDTNKSSGGVVSASPPVVLVSPKDENEPVSKAEGRGASPAVALMSSEDENKSAVSTSDDSNRESHFSQSEPKSSLVLPTPVVSGEKQAPPIDTILMVPEKGDDHSYTSFADSNSSSTSRVKVDDTLTEPRKDVSNGHTIRESGTDALKAGKDEKTEAKIVARPSPDDDYMAAAAAAVSSPHHRRSVSVDLIAKVPANYSSSPSPSPKLTDSPGLTRGQIDTAPPIDSVKSAVSKFGGIVDWKAHRVHTVERRKFIELELERAQEEMPVCKQQCRAANEAKKQVLKELESTKRLIEELKLNLERAQMEEQQAKQDSELAKLRVEEMEQGIADEASFAAKAQLEVAKARHAAAVSELKSVKEELEQLRKDYDLLIAEKESAERKAEEALATSKEVEKSVENLTIELITLKQSLDSAHSAHLEAEEHRVGAVLAKEHDSQNWVEELKQAEEELQKLNHQMLTVKELKSKLAEARTLLQDLKAELAAYMESKSDQTGKEVNLEDPLKQPETKTRADIETAINAAKKELLDVKHKIEKATKEVNILKVASASLKSQLEKENMELQAIQQREEMASTAADSLETEIDRIKSEIGIIQMKEKEEREKLVELPMQLQKAAQEAEQAKALASAAGDELEKAKAEVEEAKAGVSTRESKLRAVESEIKAARAAERLALAAITALKESESAQRNVKEDSANGITLSLEEYYELSKRAHEAEEQANARVAAAKSQIEIAKESEVKSIEKLEEVSGEMSRRKEALAIALQKAEQASERKLGVEQELRKWRGDHEQKRKHGKESKNHDSSGHHQRSPKSSSTGKGADSSEGKGGKKKKKSFFPRIFMFLGRRKSHSSKPE